MTHLIGAQLAFGSYHMTFLDVLVTLPEEISFAQERLKIWEARKPVVVCDHNMVASAICVLLARHVLGCLLHGGRAWQRQCWQQCRWQPCVTSAQPRHGHPHPTAEKGEAARGRSLTFSPFSVVFGVLMFWSLLGYHVVTLWILVPFWLSDSPIPFCLPLLPPSDIRTPERRKLGGSGTGIAKRNRRNRLCWNPERNHRTVGAGAESYLFS